MLLLGRLLYVIDKEQKTVRPNEEGKIINSRAETRCRCMARMAIALVKSGKWVVKLFDDKHAHEMTSPSKVMKIRSHNKLTEVSNELIKSFHKFGLRPSKIAPVLSHSIGGIEIANVNALCS